MAPGGRKKLKISSLHQVGGCLLRKTLAKLTVCVVDIGRSISPKEHGVNRVDVDPGLILKRFDVADCGEGGEGFCPNGAGRYTQCKIDGSGEMNTRPPKTSLIAVKRSVATRGFTTYPKAPAARPARTKSESE